MTVDAWHVTFAAHAKPIYDRVPFHATGCQLPMMPGCLLPCHPHGASPCASPCMCSCVADCGAIHRRGAAGGCISGACSAHGLLCSMRLLDSAYKVANSWKSLQSSRGVSAAWNRVAHHAELQTCTPFVFPATATHHVHVCAEPTIHARVHACICRHVWYFLLHCHKCTTVRRVHATVPELQHNFHPSPRRTCQSMSWISSHPCCIHMSRG